MSEKQQQQQQQMAVIEREGFQAQGPPPGYPTLTEPPQMEQAQVPVKTQTRGEKGFIEGCLAGLCCCWLCEECC